MTHDPKTLRAAAEARPDAYAVYGADRTDAYAKGYCAGVEAYRKSILALADTPPEPVSVEDAARVLRCIEANWRKRMGYPDGYGNTLNMSSEWALGELRAIAGDQEPHHD
ncbi:hypothetical protein GCM10011360_17960 [Primorskyibacter flagellatus]|uniref:Uncharacterized protein n=1 Tax=Primorskyibacter flagellatus TaxID=1387277 RepID=A0A917EE43_9RHOB|nr:hypothetical protein [Primorskyibacter flagellatus]GGE30345.1 hypothetical protein GCM10011360_17960 [Primorskyibacter flagellatus]